MLSLSDIKDWLGIPSATTTYDTILTNLETRAVAFLENQTDRYFGAPLEFTEILDGNDRDELWLREEPNVIRSVAYRDSLNNAWIEYDVQADYEQDGRRLLRLDDTWPRGRRNLKVVYVAGYSAGNEPDDIKQALFDLIALKFRGRGTESFKSQELGDYKYTKADMQQMPGLTDTLAKYRRVWMG